MGETKKIKFLCSFGGKILEDPRDGNLVYVGGTTKVIGISSATSWQQLKQKSMSIYSRPHAIKYELPGQDLDVLVSVHSDTNLRHMIEFCGGGGKKLPRMFLFDVNSNSDAGPNVASGSGSSEASATDVASRAPPSWSTTSSNLSERNEDSRASAEPQEESPQASGAGAEPQEEPPEESTFEGYDEFILDTSVGEIDLTNLQEIDNKDLEELKELGSSAFGTVYQGKWRGTDVAINRINKNCFTGRLDRMILESLKEAGIIANLLHPNVVSLYGFVLDELGNNPLAIVTELVVDGSLRNILLRKDMYLDHYKRLIIAMGAASGMEYLHLKKIVHFDLKCDNLLVDLKDPSWPICKVADFGLSKVKKDSLVSGGLRGTLPWMAPELLRGERSKVSEKVDVFSFGIVMWEILTGDVPYAGMLEGEIIGGIFSDTLRPPVPASCDPGWRRLMEDCWASNPQQRPSFTQITKRLQRMLVASCAEAGK